VCQLLNRVKLKRNGKNLLIVVTFIGLNLIEIIQKMLKQTYLSHFARLKGQNISNWKNKIYIF